MRSRDVFPEKRALAGKRQMRVKGCFHDMEGIIRLFDQCQSKEYTDDKDSDEDDDPSKSAAMQMRRIQEETRVFQNERILFDERGQKIKDHIVYKDFVSTITHSLTSR